MGRKLNGVKVKSSRSGFPYTSKMFDISKAFLREKFSLFTLDFVAAQKHSDQGE